MTTGVQFLEHWYWKSFGADFSKFGYCRNVEHLTSPMVTHKRREININMLHGLMLDWICGQVDGLAKHDVQVVRANKF